MAEWLATYADCSFDAVTYDRGFAELLGGVAQSLAVSGSRSADWQAVFRLNAERELTQRVFAARRGEPPQPASTACIDGGWEYVPAKPGVTIRYKGAMQPTPDNAIDYPLEMTIGRAN